MLSIIIVLILCYLIGSIPSSLWMGKIFYKVDIREHGSGNAGATNTFRILGWKAGTIVLLFDFGKGLLATAVISQLAYSIGDGPITFYEKWDVNSMLLILSGLAAVVGHMFPLYANFKGGKGAATACGMLYGIEPVSISISLAIFLILMFSTRYVSVGSIFASLLYPFSQLTLRYGFDFDIDGSIILFSSALALGIIIKHKGNIKRLLNGTENRIKSFKPSGGRLNKEESSA
ncbi:glycerol-3-phosphate 1-O-acyltransferase PlsY [Rhodohalobacter halophilus]|uniref:glycerol-3-phosphate 1-O-acyltransferase PlsY n=1 Tax=Rhodohalobacter halophilus TaxID=1812810 RepID=UPI00083F9130|nr:glycerol-3-phosphate 1-O-acyltransferase PlsY [Rhodohalobacter halophilus]